MSSEAKQIHPPRVPGPSLAIADMPRGPNGRRLCRQCQTETRNNRTTFCGQPCVHEWNIVHDTNYARGCVARRDEGVCVECGIDTFALSPWLNLALQHIAYVRGRRANAAHFGVEFVETPEEAAGEAFVAALEALGWSRARMKARIGASLWDMDHVVPVVEGGGSCGLSNLRTVCLACHDRATAALAKRRAVSRRATAADARAAINTVRVNNGRAPR